MNKCFFLSLVFSVLAINWKAQAQATIDFESEVIGAYYTWAIYEIDDSLAFSIEANSNLSGINTSHLINCFNEKSL